MRIIDITQPLLESQVYKGDPNLSCHRIKDIATDGYNLTTLSLCLHNGTHIDAPKNVHLILLEASIIPLEGLRLSQVNCGEYILFYRQNNIYFRVWQRFTSEFGNYIHFFISFLIITAMSFILMASTTLSTIQLLTFIQMQTPQEIVGKVISCFMAISLCD